MIYLLKTILCDSRSVGIISGVLFKMDNKVVGPLKEFIPNRNL